MLKVKEIMTTDLVCIPPWASILEVALQMKRFEVGTLPVCDQGRLMGVITERTIVTEVVAAGLKPDTVQVQSFMRTKVPVCSPEDVLLKAAATMAEERTRKLPVVEAGMLVGLITLSDLAAVSENFVGMVVSRTAKRRPYMPVQLRTG
ncbi:MAG: CBS domain-containing protein [Chloroflexi bacterium]|nr:CBS domain-containing protein [Chloroflexota bacterium]